MHVIGIHVYIIYMNAYAHKSQFEYGDIISVSEHTTVVAAACRASIRRGCVPNCNPHVSPSISVAARYTVSMC